MEDPMEAEFVRHPRYRNLADEVGRVLDSFDKANDWADLHKCLHKLHKVFAKYEMCPAVPARVTLAKRLAQCLSPALPGGVHLKTLETYKIIFIRIGSQRLANTLPVWTAGLFPLVAYASTQIRPLVLDLYEEYFLPLHEELIPCLSGIILSILHALEEENSEIYPRALQLLGSIRDSVGNAGIFYRTLWKCFHLNSGAHMGALHYLEASLPNPIPPEDYDTYLPDRGTLVLQGLAAALRHDNVYVLRAALELVNKNFPLNSDVMSESEFEELSHPMLAVLLRRDQSLVRRVHQWFLGPKGTVESHQEYLEQHGRRIVISAFRDMIIRPPTTPTFAGAPYKTMTMAVDRSELASIIITDLLDTILLSVIKYRTGYAFSEDLTKFANAFLDVLEPADVWRCVSKMVSASSQSHEQLESTISLVDGLLEMKALDRPETPTHHLPHLLLLFMRALTDSQQLPGPLFRSALRLSLRLYGQIPLSTDIGEEMLKDYPSKLQEAFEKVFASVCTQATRKDFSDTHNNANEVDVEVFHLACRFLLALHSVQLRSGDAGTISSSGTPAWYHALQPCCTLADNGIACIAMRTTLKLLLVQHSSVPHHSLSPYLQDLSILAQRLWEFLVPRHAAVHYAAVELMLSLQRLHEDTVGSVIARALSQGATPARIDAYRRFGLLWRLAGEIGAATERPFTNGLFLMLDTLEHADPAVRMVGQHWLADAIERLERILDPLLLVLLNKNTARKAPNHTYVSVYDTRRVTYALRTLQTVMTHHPQVFFRCLHRKQISSDILELNEDQHIPLIPSSQPGRRQRLSSHGDHVTHYCASHPNFPLRDYVDLLVLTALRFIQGSVSDSISTPDFVAQNQTVRVQAAEFCSIILGTVARCDLTDAAVYGALLSQPVLLQLHQAASEDDSVMQVHLLDLMTRAMEYMELNRSSQWNVVKLNRNTSNLNLGPDGSPHLQPGSDGSSPQLSLTSAGTPQVNTVPTAEGVSGAVPPSAASSALALYDDPLFLQTILLGLTNPHSRDFTVRSKWVSFSTDSLAYLATSKALHITVRAILPCLCEIVTSLCSPVQYDSITSHDLIVLLKGLRSVVTFCVTNVYYEGSRPADLGRDSSASGSAAGGGSGSGSGSGNGNTSVMKSVITAPGRMFTGIVDGVSKIFDNSDKTPEMLSPKQLALQEMFNSLGTLLLALTKAWDNSVVTSQADSSGSGRGNGNGSGSSSTTTGTSPPQVPYNSISDAMGASMTSKWADGRHNRFTVQDHVLNVVQPVMSRYPRQTLSFLVGTWTSPEASPQARRALVGILNGLEAASPEIVIATIVDNCLPVFRASHRKGRTSKGPGEQMWEVVYLEFLETYLRDSSFARLDSLARAWPSFFTLFREVVGHARHPTIFLRALAVIDIYVKRSPSLDDRRARKELQEVSAKLLDLCLQVAGMTFDYAVSKKGSAGSDKNTQAVVGSSKGPSVMSRMIPGRSQSFSSAAVKDKVKLHFSLQALVALNRIMPALVDTVFSDDKERYINIIMAGLPHIMRNARNKNPSHFSHAHSATQLLVEFSKYPVATRAWARSVLEAFQDSMFFFIHPRSFDHWASLVNIVLTMDKVAFVDICQRVAVPPPNVFMSKEADSIHRARHLKRTAFALYCGEVDQYVGSVPVLLEKLVESLKVAKSSVLVHVQVFFCLRVVLVRVSPEQLTNFWPIIWEELLRIFATHAREPVQLSLLLAAFKFLDLLIVLMPEKFSYYQWMFLADFITNSTIVNDVTDASSTGGSDPDARARYLSPYIFKPFVETLAQSAKHHQLPAPSKDKRSYAPPTPIGTVSTQPPPQHYSASGLPLRRPLILMRGVTDVDSLETFIANFTDHVEQNTLAASEPDIDYIDWWLACDLIEYEVKFDTSRTSRGGTGASRGPGDPSTGPSDTGDEGGNDGADDDTLEGEDGIEDGDDLADVEVSIPDGEEMGIDAEAATPRPRSASIAQAKRQ